jgi:hypothetical protein
MNYKWGVGVRVVGVRIVGVRVVGVGVSVGVGVRGEIRHFSDSV